MSLVTVAPAAAGSRLNVAVRRRRRAMAAEALWLWGAVAVFIGVSGWWWARDDRILDWDSGVHLGWAVIGRALGIRSPAGGSTTAPGCTSPVATSRA